MEAFGLSSSGLGFIQNLVKNDEIVKVKVKVMGWACGAYG